MSGHRQQNHLVSGLLHTTVSQCSMKLEWHNIYIRCCSTTLEMWMTRFGRLFFSLTQRIAQDWYLCCLCVQQQYKWAAWILTGNRKFSAFVVQEVEYYWTGPKTLRGSLFGHLGWQSQSQVILTFANTCETPCWLPPLFCI